jgi:hypothetical protein
MAVDTCDHFEDRKKHIAENACGGQSGNRLIRLSLALYGFFILLHVSSPHHTAADRKWPQKSCNAYACSLFPDTKTSARQKVTTVPQIYVPYIYSILLSVKTRLTAARPSPVSLYRK